MNKSLLCCKLWLIAFTAVVATGCASRSYTYHVTPAVITEVVVTKAEGPDQFHARFDIQEAHGLKRTSLSKPSISFIAGQDAKVSIESAERTIVATISSQKLDQNTLDYTVDTTTTTNNGKNSKKLLFSRRLSY